jgi:CRISPR/Cas system-associated exonuclease Cas4 (RecB family)
MALPLYFQFSQSSLQDFVTCRRRFELRYLKKLRWPAVPFEPAAEAEQLTRLGQAFHRLVHQHLIGLKEEMLTESAQHFDPQLQSWWSDYLDQRPALPEAATVYPELTLTVPLGDYRLQARFDVLAAVGDGKFLIIDWKTSRKKPTRTQLAKRLQTLVYPYVLARAGAPFNGGRAVDPPQIITTYWYPQFPAEPEVFFYSPAQFEQDEQTLKELAAQVEAATQTGNFPKTENVVVCRHCVYRSLCDRGKAAGAVDEDVLTESLAPAVDDAGNLEQTAEVYY